jgi:hypothetical protein
MPPGKIKSPKIWVLPLIIFFLSVLLLILHSLYYWPFISDDALISLRYAQRFLNGQGLTWTDGIPVEGYSNLLWVLAVSLLGWIGFDLIISVRVLGYVCMVGVLGAMFYRYNPRNTNSILPYFAASLFLVLSSPIAVWTIGGLEQPLVAFLLSCGIVLSFSFIEKESEDANQALKPGFFFSLLVLTRPDGFLFTLCALLAFVLLFKDRKNKYLIYLKFATLPVLFLLGQLVFRILYYGELIPNSALVKISPSNKHLFDGIRYVLSGSFVVLPLFAAAFIALILCMKKSRIWRINGIFLVVPGLFWATYILVIGGDIFPAWRHMVPLIIFAAFMVGENVKCLGLRFEWKNLVILTLCLTMLVFFQFSSKENIRAKQETWEWDGQVVGLLLKKAFGGQQPLLAVDPAGCVPYWSELPSIDMLGINDYYIPRNKPFSFGQGAIGHELGDGRYVLNRKPDLVLFCLPKGSYRACFQSGIQMQEQPGFFLAYKPLIFEGLSPYKVHSLIWVRKDSPKVGLRYAPDLIYFPGYLLDGYKTPLVRFSEKIGLFVEAKKFDILFIEDLLISNGQWTLKTEPLEMSVKVKIFQKSDGKLLYNGSVPAVFYWPGNDVNVKIVFSFNEADTETVYISSVNLEKTGF